MGMLALLLVAVSVGLDNLAAAIGIGVSGVDAVTRLRVGLVFGVFEAGMPVIGLLAGHGLATQAGSVTRWLGAGLLIAVGGYGLVRSLRLGADGDASAGLAGNMARLIVVGFALSVDNLVVGFALGTFQIGILTAGAVIGAISVTMSLAGLELGARIGRLAGQRGEQIGGLILISVGVAIAAGTLS
jgi:manganese efflux pump family protein